VLIIVEGISHHRGEQYGYGANLLGVADCIQDQRERQNRGHCVALAEGNRLVYSPHDYPPSVIAHEWAVSRDFPGNMPGKFDHFWGFIFRAGVAPVLLGEFGSRLDDRLPRSSRDRAWLNALIGYLNGDFAGTGQTGLAPEATGISWAWWALNPNTDASDTGGLYDPSWTVLNANALPPAAKAQVDALAPLMSAQRPLPAIPATAVRPVFDQACSAQVTFPSNWGTGCTVDVRVTARSTPLSGWRVTMTLPPGFSKPADGGPWDAVLATSSPNLLVFDYAPHKGDLPQGQSSSFRFNAVGGPCEPRLREPGAIRCEGAR
jgi:hypothetical protein